MSTRLTSASRIAFEWTRAWANAELGYVPTEEELALLDDANRRPDYYLRGGPPKNHKPPRGRKRKGKPFKLPSVIV